MARTKAKVVPKRKRLSPAAKVGARIVRTERAFIKRRDADRARRGFGLDTAPDDFNLDHAVEARIRPFIVDAKAAFVASKNTEAAIKTLEEAVVPRLDEILAQLGQVTRRVFALEQGLGKHVSDTGARFDKHENEITGLHKRIDEIKKGIA